ncbi:MAG: hypothetical protein ACYSX0_00305 [Planctomycetota bacterium]|jgi:hypothetical protein
MHTRDIAAALAELRDTLEKEAIPFAVIGALAMRQHGYVRHTEDIDIVTSSDGLARIHERLVGRGIVPRAAGLRKKLKDTKHQVGIDVLQAGEHAGAEGSPVRYPDPDSDAFTEERDGIRYATLTALMAFKIASGLWGKRPRDLADAQELIKANELTEDFAMELPEQLREDYLRLVAASREEKDIE